jgi:hypothetical protein
LDCAGELGVSFCFSNGADAEEGNGTRIGTADFDEDITDGKAAPAAGATEGL